MSNEAKLQISPERFTLKANNSSSAATHGNNTTDNEDRVPITITNTSSSIPLVFRMLTTDKANFTVSPREGILQPGAMQTTMITYTGRGVAKEGKPHLTEASFKLEYRGLIGDKDRIAVEDIANGNGDSNSISDLLKAVADKEDKKSVVLTCKIIATESDDEANNKGVTKIGASSTAASGNTSKNSTMTTAATSSIMSTEAHSYTSAAPSPSPARGHDGGAAASTSTASHGRKDDITRALEKGGVVGSAAVGNTDGKKKVPPLASNQLLAAGAVVTAIVVFAVAVSVVRSRGRK